MTEDIAEIMSEAPGGIIPNEGIPAGFGVVDTNAGGVLQDSGLTAHRGVLQEGEYVDAFVLRDAACELLGFTYDDISSVYRQGPLSPDQRQLRARIDARLLSLSRSGGNMAKLADALGRPRLVFDRAIARAKALWVEPIVKNPAVVTDRVCFIEETRDATPRRRRFSKSPEQWVGTINLSERAYARGFEEQPGSPAYWESRDQEQAPPTADSQLLGLTRMRELLAVGR